MCKVIHTITTSTHTHTHTLMSILNTIAKVLTAELSKSLPEALAKRFELDSEEVKSFLSEYLSDQLGKVTKKRSKKDGPGRVSGYLVFSAENRNKIKKENSDISFGEMNSELGKRWKALSESTKKKWNDKAKKQNEDNGIVTGKKTSVKAKKPEPKKEKVTDVKVIRNPVAKVWVVQGTQFVVASPKDKTIIGKMRGNKVISLSQAEVKACKAKGWNVKETTSKRQKGKKVEEAEGEEEGEAEGEEEEDE